MKKAKIIGGVKNASLNKIKPHYQCSYHIALFRFSLMLRNKIAHTVSLVVFANNLVSSVKNLHMLTVHFHQRTVIRLSSFLSSISHRCRIIGAFRWCENRPEAEIAVRWRREAEVKWSFDEPISDRCFWSVYFPVYLLPFPSY
jgi:hypothetical protein